MAKSFTIPPRPRSPGEVANALPALAQNLPAVLPTSAAEAIAGERLRIQSILECAEAETRPAAARRLALHSNMQADEARQFLASLPEERSARDRLAEQFFGRMDGMAETLAVAPGLTPGAVTGDRKGQRRAELAETMKGFNASRGYKAGDRTTPVRGD